MALVCCVLTRCAVALQELERRWPDAGVAMQAPAAPLAPTSAQAQPARAPGAMRGGARPDSQPEAGGSQPWGSQPGGSSQPRGSRPPAAKRPRAAGF
jgi:hypothetical protein